LPRLFAGIEIPKTIGIGLTMLRGGLPGARWIDPENYHITLRFIGDVDGSTASDVADMLMRVKRRSFRLHLAGVDAFGGRKPRGVHARVAPTAALLALQMETEQIIQRAGLPPEGRKFVPHVSLARLRDCSQSLVAEYLSLRGSYASLPFDVGRFVLFSSQPFSGGGPYVVEEAYPLAA
jgi:RNA 2',3'-cyclic 3'-phosphodiesterase